MSPALFLNGVFEEVLEEILTAQQNTENLTCFLQPYSSRVIKLLEKNDFDIRPSIPFYLSTTLSLSSVVYVAEIVGWTNKRDLIGNKETLNKYNQQIKTTQPIQEEVYFYSDKEQSKECVNLIFVKNIKKLTHPLSTSYLTKKSDNLPLKPRTRSGGWSSVQLVPTELLEARKVGFKEVINMELIEKVSASLVDSNDARNERLKTASKTAEVMQIISTGFRRNPDVIAAVLLSAKGICQRCNFEAPFIRKKDNSPYLEVHHKHPLADGGEDTVVNAQALCPNCHREVHFGM